MKGAARIGGACQGRSPDAGQPAGGAGLVKAATVPRAATLALTAVLTLVATLVLAVPAEAQWQIGFQGGATLATLRGSFADGAEPTLGGALGGDLELWLGPDWVVDVDAGLVQRGAVAVPVDPERPDVTLTYLEAPITLGRAFPVLGEGWRLGPYAGVALAWLSSCGLRFPGEPHDVDCTEGTSGGRPARLDPSLPVGVALRHRYPGGSRFSVEVRYSYSMASALSAEELSARSHLLQALFGFTLPLSDPVP